MTGCTARAALTVAACAAEVVEDFFPADVPAVPADPLLAEEADLTSVTLPVGSTEPMPVAFFPPVVFAIAIAFSPLPGKQTAENLTL
jgi:hypothetical protein